MPRRLGPAQVFTAKRVTELNLFAFKGIRLLQVSRGQVL